MFLGLLLILVLLLLILLYLGLVSNNTNFIRPSRCFWIYWFRTLTYLHDAVSFWLLLSFLLWDSTVSYSVCLCGSYFVAHVIMWLPIVTFGNWLLHFDCSCYYYHCWFCMNWLWCHFVICYCLVGQFGFEHWQQSSESFCWCRSNIMNLPISWPYYSSHNLLIL